jgi:arginyl-tRNA synthetase
VKLLIDRWLSPYRAALAEVAGAAGEGLDAAGLLGPARDPKHGTLSSGAAFKLAGGLKQPPIEIARRIAEACARRIVEFPDLMRVDVAPPGYVNFAAAPAFYAALVGEILHQGHSFGRSTRGRDQAVDLEFCSANPTGPLHVAHGRQAAVGDCLANILDFAGYPVTREYYWNDTGQQIVKLIGSVAQRARQLTAGQSTDAPIEDGYSGAYVVDLARQLIEDKGADFVLAPPAGEGEAALRREVVGRLKDQILADLADFGVRYDVQASQDELERSGKVRDLIDAFRARGLVYEKDGALWFRAQDFGDTQDWVLVKTDGSYTYRAPDYAYHRGKFERGFARVVDLWGPDHHAYVGSVRAGLKAMESAWADRFKVLLVQFCKMVRGREEIKMSKRGGTFVPLREVVDEVGPDAARFFFVLRRLDSHLTFDLELAKAQKSENPVFYVQYAHARIASVLRKAQEQYGPLGLPGDGRGWVDAALPGEGEAQLLQVTGRFPDAVERAAEELEPYVITEYLLGLAAALQSYYQKGDKDERLRMIHPEPGTRRMRLAAARAVQVVLRNGLSLLGVGAPERMDAPVA